MFEKHVIITLLGICTLARKMTSFRKHHCALGLGLELGLRLAEIRRSLFKPLISQLALKSIDRDNMGYSCLYSYIFG